MPFKIDSKLIQLFRKNGPQNLPREINVKINSIAKEICFLQSASAPSESDPQKPEAPTVKIVYADGSNVSIPVRYFSEVVYWNDVKGCAKSRLGVTFKTTENAIVNFYIAKIQNPHPEKTIASINLIAGDASWSLVIAAITITK